MMTQPRRQMPNNAKEAICNPKNTSQNDSTSTQRRGKALFCPYLSHDKRTIRKNYEQLKENLAFP